MRSVLVLALLLALSIPAYAAYVGPHGDAPAATVKQVLTSSPDDAKLCMEGHIINKLPTSDKKYTFQDSTGDMVVEIKEVVFGGANVGPTNKVRICGKVDKEYLKNNEFEVKTLQVMGK